MTKPLLILICGRPGSGKSTLALQLAQELKAILLDKDFIDEAFSPDDRGPLYRTTIQPGAYQSLLNLAAPNLLLGHSVILDAPWTHQFFYEPELGTKVLKLAETTESKLIVFEIELPPEGVRERLAKRGLKRDTPKLTEEGWKDFLHHQRLGDKNPLPHHPIDGQDSPEECLQHALKYIQKKVHLNPDFI